jgi:hypothetical protein
MVLARGERFSRFGGWTLACSVAGMKLIHAVVLCCAAVTSAGCWGNCTAVCFARASLQLRDTAGNPVRPVGGTVLVDDRTLAFSCQGGGQLPDGGLLQEVECDGSVVTVIGSKMQPMTFTVTDTLGRAFSGDVALTFTESGAVCGSACRFASAQVTLR